MDKAICEVAESLVGTKEGSRAHQTLVDTYNKIVPLPRGYKVSYTDAWCAVFVSVVEFLAGNKTFPFECGVYEMEQGLIAKGYASDKPVVGGVVIFPYSHCGIVIDADGESFITVEGNASDQVMRRRYNNSTSYRFYRSF